MFRIYCFVSLNVALDSKSIVIQQCKPPKSRPPSLPPLNVQQWLATKRSPIGSKNAILVKS